MLLIATSDMSLFSFRSVAGAAVFALSKAEGLKRATQAALVYEL